MTNSSVIYVTKINSYKKEPCGGMTLYMYFYMLFLMAPFS